MNSNDPNVTITETSDCWNMAYRPPADNDCPWNWPEQLLVEWDDGSIRVTTNPGLRQPEGDEVFLDEAAARQLGHFLIRFADYMGWEDDEAPR